MKIINKTKNNYKIKDVTLKKVYKIEKESNIEITVNDNSILEIIDSSYYDFKSLIKLILLFIIMFIPYVICTIIGIDNMWYGYKIIIDSNDTFELTIEEKSNKLILKNKENKINCNPLKLKSLLISLALITIALLFYGSIILLIYNCNK